MDDTSSILKKELEDIDVKIAESNEAIKMGDSLKHLMKCPHFKLVILDGYVEAEANKLFKILTNPSGASPYSNEVIQLKLEAISHFRGHIGTDDYPGTIRIEAERAPLDIIREEAFRQEVTANAANGDN